jgi:hypothetical protein
MKITTDGILYDDGTFAAPDYYETQGERKVSREA